MANARQASAFSSVAAGLGASKRLAKNYRYVYEDFTRGRVATGDGLGGAAAVTDAAINQVVAPSGRIFEFRLEQAFAGAAPQVKNGATGLLLQTDAADNDGIALSLGNGAAAAETPNAGAFVVGTDAAFFLRVKIKIADVSEADEIAVGFVKGGYGAGGLLSDLTDFAVINVDNGAAKLQTRLNSGSVGSVASGTTVADTGSITLEVRVNASGVVKFLINDAAPTTDVTGFTFDTGDTVQALLTILNDAAGTPAVEVLSWESGFISSRGLESINEIVTETAATE